MRDDLVSTSSHCKRGKGFLLLYVIHILLQVMCCAFMLGTVSTIFQYTSYTSASTQTEYRRLSTDADWTSHLNTEQLPEDVPEESFPETDSEFPEADSEIPEL